MKKLLVSMVMVLGLATGAFAKGGASAGGHASASHASASHVSTPSVSAKSAAPAATVKASAPAVKASVAPAVSTKASVVKAGGAVKPMPTKPATSAKAPAKVVDINSATEAELRAIPGIGPKYAAKIIAGRPYTGKDQIVKAGVPQGVYAKTSLFMIAKQNSAKPVFKGHSSASKKAKKAVKK